MSANHNLRTMKSDAIDRLRRQRTEALASSYYVRCSKDSANELTKSIFESHSISPPNAKSCLLQATCVAEGGSGGGAAEAPMASSARGGAPRGVLLYTSYVVNSKSCKYASQERTSQDNSQSLELLSAGSPTVTNSTMVRKTWKKKKSGGYIVFCKEMRPKIVKENPWMSFGNIGKALGAAWIKLTDTQKSSYVTVDTIHACYYEAEEQEEEKTNNFEEEMLNCGRGKRARVEGGIGSQSKHTRKEGDTGKRVQVDGGRVCKQCHQICANEVAVHR